MPILRKKYSGFFQLNFYLFSNSQTKKWFTEIGSDSKTIPVGEEGVLGGGSVAKDNYL